MCWFVCSCLFFSAGLLKLNFNDTLVSSTHIFPVNIFNLEGGETMLARDKGNFQALVENRTWDPPVQNGWNVRYSIRRVVSSILAPGTKFFVVPG